MRLQFLKPDRKKVLKDNRLYRYTFSVSYEGADR